MKDYRITNRDRNEVIGYVKADSYLEAGTKAAKVVNPHPGRGRNVVGLRVTGDHDKSGMFQGYYPMAGSNGQMNSIGPNFHLSEV